jgi:hypothetical protein
VFLNTFLGEAVEGKRGDGAVEMRGGDAPGAVVATSVGEVKPFDPAFIHTSISVLDLPCQAFSLSISQRDDLCRRSSMEAEHRSATLL